MKNQNSIKGLALSVLMLTAILIQSAHSFVHLAETVRQEHCDHEYAAHKNTINHDHKSAESCFACEFTFSIGTSPEITRIDHSALSTSDYLPVGHYERFLKFFSGSLFLYRGPPAIIV